MEREYKLRDTVETDRAIIRLYVPTQETEEEKEAFRRECVRVNREIATRLYREGKIEKRIATS